MSSILNYAEPELLSIRGLSVSIGHRLGDKSILQDVSLDVGAGEIVGVVGESGAGKSTVGNAIIGLLQAPAKVDAGKLLFRGQDLVPLSPAQRAEFRGRHIGMIFQDPQTALDPLMPIGRQLIETIRNRSDLDRKQAYERAVELLHQVGISDDATRFQAYPHQFSGGMRQRVVIALALCAEPSLIVADEPTTALDVTLQRQILAVIQKARRERGLGIVLITHNMGVVNEIADRVVVMRNGRVVEQGATAKVLGRPSEAYTKTLIAAVPRIESGAPSRANGGTLVRDGGPSRAAAIEARGVSVSFKKNRNWLGKTKGYMRALDDVSFKLYQGEALGIVGESGSGKSTLARCIAGITRANAGAISIDHSRRGNDPRPQPLQMIFQDPYASLNPGLRVGDIVGEALDYYRICRNNSERNDRVEAMLQKVGLPRDAMMRFPHQFSGGQRQRISIARALISNPNVLICDEPTSALDVSVQQQVLELLEELQREAKLSILFISHDLAIVRRICTRVAVMRLGRIVEIGEVDDVFDRPAHTYTRELIAAMPSTAGLAQASDVKDVVVAL